MTPFEHECSHEQQQLCTRHETSLVSVYFVLTLALGTDREKSINVTFVVKRVFSFKNVSHAPFQQGVFLLRNTKKCETCVHIYLIH